MDVGAAEESQCLLSLREEATPQVEGEKGVNRTEARNQMGLAGLDGPFSGVCSMIIWRHTLEGVFVGMDNDGLQGLWTFIVHLVVEGGEASFCKESIDLLIHPT